MEECVILHSEMKYAIIAAGEGSRLAEEGISAPKPLVKVGGQCLVDRLIRVFLDNEADIIGQFFRRFLINVIISH